MHQHEIIRMIRKLSWRRHSATKQLAVALKLPHGNREQIRNLRAYITGLSSEINSLLGRI